MNYTGLTIKDNVAVLSVDVIENPIQCLPNANTESPIKFLETNEKFDKNGISIADPSMFHCIFPSSTSLAVIDLFLDTKGLYRNQKVPVLTNQGYSAILAHQKSKRTQKSL